MEEGVGNFRIRVGVQAFLKGRTEGDLIGQAIGDAVQKIKASGGTSLSEAATAAFEAINQGEAWSSNGKLLHSKAKDFHYKLQLTGRGAELQTQALGALLAIGASGWGGALAAVGAAFGFFGTVFAGDDDAIQLAIELSLRGHMTGSVFIPLQEGSHRYYLPGRFNFGDAVQEGLALHDFSAVDRVMPRYDRTMGHFGYRADPAETEFHMLVAHLHPAFPHESADFVHYAFPVDPGRPQAPHDFRGPPEFDHLKETVDFMQEWLRVIYNPYAEIVPVTPVPLRRERVLGGSYHGVDVTEDDHRKWFNWVQDLSPRVHIPNAEPGDEAFPEAGAFGEGSRLYVNTIGSAEVGGQVYSPIIDEFMLWSPALDPVWSEVLLEERMVPGLYKNFTPVENLRVHKGRHIRLTRFKTIDPAKLPCVKGHAPYWKCSNAEVYFAPTDPFPLTDVVFNWDVSYYHYARSRISDGSVPLYQGMAHLRSPVTIYFSYDKWWDTACLHDDYGCSGYVNYWDFDDFVKSRLLVE